MLEERLHILLVEDNPGDVHLFRAMLAEAGRGRFRIAHRGTLAEALGYPASEPLDVALLDLGLPDAAGLEALHRFQKARPALAVVVLTGADDDEKAMAAIAAGAQDYLVKGKVDGELLVRSIRYSRERKRAAEEKERLVRELEDALARVKTLRGLLPICAGCKKVRDDKGYWNEIEVYVRAHSEASFTHGLCPDCVARLYPGIQMP